jgi:transposase-like protein
VSVVVIAAVGVNTEGQREVRGLNVGASEAEPFPYPGIRLWNSDCDATRPSRRFAALPG